MAAACFTRRSSALLHNLLKNLSPLRGWAAAPYTFTTTDNTRAPCRHGGQGSAISYTARGPTPRRHFTSSRGGTTKRSIYDRFMDDLFQKKEKHIHFISSYLSDSKRLQSTTVDYKRLINGQVLTNNASLRQKHKNAASWKQNKLITKK